MVFLTMTAAIVAAVKACQELDKAFLDLDGDTEPSLDDPAIGNPISHTQVLALSKSLKKHRELQSSISSHLDELLRGSKIYYEPHKPKAEPVSRREQSLGRFADASRPLSTKH